jgi:hypothetical protein
VNEATKIAKTFSFVSAILEDFTKISTNMNKHDMPQRVGTERIFGVKFFSSISLVKTL